MFSDQLIVYAFGWTSWSSIIAGAVAAMALWIVMVILGIALGFTVIEPKSDHPAAGLGKAFGIWYAVSVIVSLAGGGFTAGLLSGQRGMEHGFLVWAIVVLVSMLFSGTALGSALKTFGSALRSIGSGTASMASGMGSSAMNALSNGINQLHKNIDIDIDTEKLNSNIMATLRDTGEEKLQPEYLSGQLREARSDLRQALHRVSRNPSDAEAVVTAFLETQKQRLTRLADGFDREAAVKAIMAKRNIAQEEAQTMVDDAICMYEHTLHKVRESIAEANEQVKDAKEHLHEMGVMAREKADKIASTAAKAAVGVAIALVLAALISMGAGWCGAKYTVSHYPPALADMINN